MSITEKDLREILTVEADTEKVSTVSSDGRNLLTRIPVKIRNKLGLKQGDRLRWLVRKGEVKLEVIQNAK
jgi:bifunctional DNA-binding transcriptional regulator/antitoxin component of YhaV-PrlF toxin-antitoxin module